MIPNSDSDKLQYTVADISGLMYVVKQAFSRIHYRAHHAGLSNLNFELYMPVEWRWDIIYEWARDLVGSNNVYEFRYQLDEALHANKLFLYRYTINLSTRHKDQSLFLVVTKVNHQIVNEQLVTDNGRLYWRMQAPWLSATIQLNHTHQYGNYNLKP